MKREQLRRICRKADFPHLDRVELFHLFAGALTPATENMRRLTSCAKFYASFDSSKRKKLSGKGKGVILSEAKCMRSKTHPLPHR